MLLLIAMLACNVSTTNQTGGITACSIGTVTDHGDGSYSVTPNYRTDVACLVRRGLYRRNRRGTYDRTPAAKAMSFARWSRIYDSCRVTIGD